MNNADMPAMPVIDEDGVLDCDKYKEFAMNPTIATGLTKREMMAKDMELRDIEFKNMSDFEEFIGRKVDKNSTNDMIKSQLECAAKLKVMYADALLAELEKTGETK